MIRGYVLRGCLDRDYLHNFFTLLSLMNTEYSEYRVFEDYIYLELSG